MSYKPDIFSEQDSRHDEGPEIILGALLVGDTGIEPVTSSVSGKRATAAPIALACEVGTGFEPVYTALQAVASPLGQPTVRNPCGFPGADDGIRTRDPHLGKVMLYQLSYVRVTFRLPGGAQLIYPL